MPPVDTFLARFRAVLERRRRFVFDEEVEALSRIEQAVALVALLELGKSGEARIGQSAHLDPITVWGGQL
jgi:chromatin segregation and condensation protein Rec8/ScpA/Scc1 (kleisin family)